MDQTHSHQVEFKLTGQWFQSSLKTAYTNPLTSKLRHIKVLSKLQDTQCYGIKDWPILASYQQIHRPWNPSSSKLCWYLTKSNAYRSILFDTKFILYVHKRFLPSHQLKRSDYGSSKWQALRNSLLLSQCSFSSRWGNSQESRVTLSHNREVRTFLMQFTAFLNESQWIHKLSQHSTQRSYRGLIMRHLVKSWSRHRWQTQNRVKIIRLHIGPGLRGLIWSSFWLKWILFWCQSIRLKTFDLWVPSQPTILWYPSSTRSSCTYSTQETHQGTQQQNPQYAHETAIYVQAWLMN